MKLLTLFFLLFYIHLSATEITKNTAIVNGNQVNLREKPDLKAKIVSKMNFCDLVEIVKRSERKYESEQFKEVEEKAFGYYWYKVKTYNGYSGWIYGRLLLVNGLSDFLELTDDFWEYPVGKAIKEESYRKGKVDIDNKVDVLWYAISVSGGVCETVLSLSSGETCLLNTLFYEKIRNDNPHLDIQSNDCSANLDSDFEFQDITGDGKHELIYTKRIQCYGEDSYFYKLIVSYQNNQLQPVFLQYLEEGMMFGEGNTFRSVSGSDNKISVKKVIIDEVKEEIFWLKYSYSEQNYHWTRKECKFIRGDKNDLSIKATCKANTLNLRKGPDISYEVVDNISEGQTIYILGTGYSLAEIDGKQGSWLKVRLQSGKVGWAFSYFIDIEDKLVDRLVSTYIDSK